jgi:heterotetrameric sarcosine oxidase gamma subunit
MKNMMKPIKHTPLHPTAQSLNARFVDLNGWQVAEGFDDLDAELAAARQRVVLADQSARGKIQIEGLVAGAIMQTIWSGPQLAVGQGAEMESGQIYRLRADQYFISTPPGAEEETLQALTVVTQSVDDLITVTDLTHGRAELYLLGPAGAELLSRLCGLDFHPSVFPNLAAKSSSVAKTTQLIIRRDQAGLPGYRLIGAASLGAYVWETIFQAGQDLGVIPIGQTALDSLDI